MTTYTYSLQAPSSYRLRLVSNTAVKRSVLTGAIQTVSRPGERWEIEAVWENLYGSARAQVLAFFNKLNGMEHRVTFTPWGHSQQGTLTGTPLVKGASQTGNTLAIDGATISITGWIKAGDYLSVGGHLYMCTADANSDGSGNVDIPIIPALRSSPADNAAVTVSSPRGTFILATPVDASNRPGSSTYPIISSLSLSFIDDISA